MFFYNNDILSHRGFFSDFKKLSFLKKKKNLNFPVVSSFRNT